MTDGISATYAIRAALSQNWEEAIRINTEIVKEDKNNIDALNRLGFAYLQVGNSSSAKKCFSKVLSLDQYNQIAEKNLKKLSTLKGKASDEILATQLSPLMFLEEPGRTKIVNCLNVAPARVLSVITSGLEVFLKAKKHCIEIRDSADTYLGVLPDDISFKLIKYIAGGNRYSAFVRGVGKNNLTVFVREVSRGKKFIHQPSFTTPSAYIPSARSEGTSVEKPDTTATGEDEDSDAPEEATF